MILDLQERSAGALRLGCLDRRHGYSRTMSQSVDIESSMSCVLDRLKAPDSARFLENLTLIK